MALVNCRECRAEVSKRAKHCPHCGIASPRISIAEKITYLICFGVTIGILLAFLSHSGNLESTKSELAPAAANNDPDATAKTEAEDIKIAKQKMNWDNALKVAEFGGGSLHERKRAALAQFNMTEPLKIYEYWSNFITSTSRTSKKAVDCGLRPAAWQTAVMLIAERQALQDSEFIASQRALNDDQLRAANGYRKWISTMFPYSCDDLRTFPITKLYDMSVANGQPLPIPARPVGLTEPTGR